MKTLYSIIICIVLVVSFAISEELSTVRYSISGSVFDQTYGDPMMRASVYLVELQKGTITDRNGNFSIERIPHGTYTLRVQYVGYRTHETKIVIPGDSFTGFKVELIPRVFETDEVIVTASPLGKPVLYQPAQAFSSEDIQRRATVSLGEMLDWEPGLAMRSFGSVPARPVIRGMDGDRVLILDNGERIGDLSEITPDHSIAMDPMCADRVEVVRGPASLLYGSSALGGVINVFTDDMPRMWSSGTSGAIAFYGSTMNNLGSGFGRIVHGNDNWVATGRVSYRESGNLYTPEGRLPGTFLRQFTGAAGAGFRHNNIDGGLSIEVLDKAYGLPEEIDDPDTDIEIRMDRQRVRGYLNVQSTGFFENYEFRISGSRYFHEEVEIEREEDGTVEEDMELDFIQNTLSSTLTIKHGLLGIIENGVIGVNGILRRLDTTGPEALTPNARSSFLGLFVYEEIPLSKISRLQMGGRVEFQQINAIENEKYPDFDMTRTSTTFSGSIGTNIQPSNNLEIGFQVARAHRVPSIEELFSDAAHLAAGAYEIGNPGLKNEIGHGVDVFVRYSTNRLFIDVAGFYNRVNDYIVRQPTGEIHEPSGFPIIVYEAGDAELFGGELGIKMLLHENIHFNSRLDYVHGARRDIDRTPLPFMPPLRSFIGVTYEKRNRWLGVNSRIAAKQTRTAVEEDPTDGYVLFGFESGYRFDVSGRHVVSFRMDNIFNTVYRDHLSRVEDRDNPMPGRSAHLMYKWYF